MTTQSSTIYVYTPDANENVPHKSWKPTFVSCPNTLVQGHTYTVVGKQLNGLSQAVSYGDDAQQATNYPIFKLWNASGDVVYLRSSNFSTLAVATGSKRVTADIDVGARRTDGSVADGCHRQRHSFGPARCPGGGPGLLTEFPTQISKPQPSDP